MKQYSLSAALKQIGFEDESSFMAEDTAQRTATFNARNTRFTGSRQTSANETAVPTRTTSAPTLPTPQKAGGKNPTTQSNSFVLPEMPHISELVSGVRNDGTPVFNRTAKSHSRFASGTQKPARGEYDPVKTLPAPQEEKAIYASINLAKDRADQLEMELSEAQKRAEEYESEIMDLRSQLTVIQRRPDSALGSDEDITGQEAWKKEKRNLQASVQALQDRFNRSERKISVSEIAVKRVTKERDELMTQIGVAYYNNEELKSENEAFRDYHSSLQSENQELKDEVDTLRKENQDLRLLMAQTQASYEQDTLQRERREAQLRSQLEKKSQNVKDVRNFTHELGEAKDRTQTKQDSTIRSRKEGMAARPNGRTERPKSAGALEEVANDDLTARIAQEVRKNREAAATKGHASTHGRAASQQENASARPSSKSGTRQQIADAERKVSAPKRAASAPTETNASDAESTTQLDFSQHSRSVIMKPSQPTAAKSRPVVPQEDDRDLTMLTWQDPDELNNLRKKLEEERKAGKLRSNYRVSAEKDDTQQTSQSFKQLQEDLKSGKLRSTIAAQVAKDRKDKTQQRAQSLPRKSSMKDVTNRIDDGTGRFSTTSANVDNFAKVAKSVRVQSPHTSDGSVNPHQQSEPGDTSTLSNTSRRRRRAASADAMTSAFIMPDITLNSSSTSFLAGGHTSMMHDHDNCSLCPATDKDVTIPSPVPVTDREDPDVTNATIRPAQPPPVALAIVIKQLQDEIKHLKIKLAVQQRLYNQHDPALSKRKRMDVKIIMDKLTAEIEKRSDQVYALYDVLEGQKEAAALAKKAGEEPKAMDEQEVEATLSSIGIDPAEMSGRIGRGAGLDGVNEMSGDESEELPWDGLSEVGSEF